MRQLAMGAAVLSAGGGSFPYLEYLGTRELFEKRAPVTLVAPESLPDDARVALVAMVGAPLPLFERFADPAHFTRPVHVLERHLGTRFDAVMGYEIGSMNSLIPVMVAASTELPLVDADTLGRSFPEVQTSAFAIAGLDMAPIAVCDVRANDLIIARAASGRWVEQLLRPLASACGSVIAICGAHSGLEIKQHAYHGTYSRALRIGSAILKAQVEHRDPIASLLRAERGSALASGKIIDTERHVTEGFVRGRVRILCAGAQEAIVSFQNEYLLAETGARRLAMVPDLIALFDSERGDPLGTEALRYGQHVTVVRLPPMAQHLTAKALAVVGPRAFGFDFDYQSSGDEVHP
ncbi:MAG TPA: DUF917 domain-containing protein [Steroidobacteraceae bacterium]|nr:DUF917 domain-containing protein [Steroidobacteraceae bacterium]